MENISNIAAGEYHTLMLKTDKTLWVVGSKDYGNWVQEIIMTKIIERDVMVTGSRGW